jgi:uncharacterized protein with HEPN domain
LYRLARNEEETLANRILEFREVIDFRNIIAYRDDTIDKAAMWYFAKNIAPKLVEKVGNY